ncbi:MAG TPA: aminoacetone oxidase family FAD-binding enzyme [Candidatus Wallbacteria bacterium]|mgnify:CR=1 FL=1|nr:aminoacetone oxidase family FAD-binding enzyme [Candidatus Wallbacteria bacterium]
MHKSFDIVIIGAGACAGFFTAFMNAGGFSGKLRVLIIEKLSKPFKKIAASGNGRCNYSNESISPRDYISIKPDRSFESVFFDKIKSFDFKGYLNDNLIYSRSDEYGRLFPFTNSAKTMTGFLETNLLCSGFETLFDTACRGVERPREGGMFKIKCENVKTGEKLSVESAALVFACGGAAYPQLGTDGSAFEIIKKTGHTFTGAAPSICALETPAGPLHKLGGIKLEARLKYKDFERTGEILFTDYGISGPNALYLSPHVSRDLYAGKKVRVSIDFLPVPALSPDYFTSKAGCQNEYLNLDLFSGVFNRDFLKAFFRDSGFIIEMCSKESAVKIHSALKNYETDILRVRPFNEAQVSLGGVCCGEIDPHTLESRLVKNLYFAGEVIDYTGGCGGYNIHQAAVCARILSESLVAAFGVKTGVKRNN